MPILCEVSPLNKVGRNDPCPCGSGKKYKKCCMAKDQAQEEDTSPDTAPAASDEQASQLQPGPRAAEVENIYRRAINYLDENDYDRAARAFRSVILLDRKHYKALTGLGRCLAEMGMREEARKCFQKALEIKPDYAQARINLELQT